MADAPRYLIGFGERLTTPVAPPQGGGGGEDPYTIDQARTRLSRMARAVSAQAAELPDLACPHDRVVLAITLHPKYLSKSAYPRGLFEEIDVDPVGSRPVEVIPELDVRVRNKEPQAYKPTEPRPTTRIFVDSSRSNLARWAAHLDSTQQLAAREVDIIKVEQISMVTADDRDRLDPEATVAEVVLHSDAEHAVSGLEEFCAQTGQLQVLSGRMIATGGLVFVPVIGPNTALRRLTGYSFTRALRAMPRLRRLIDPDPAVAREADASTTVELPDEPPLDADARVAVFDGGIPDDTVLAPWVSVHRFTNSAAPEPAYLQHGQRVTSAVLFGSVDPDVVQQRPYGRVEHYQVLDSDTDADPLDLYTAIERIEQVLTQRRFEFVSISIGPDLPIEDDEIHAWTAFWDSHLADGMTLTTVAIGNNGHLDRGSGNARVQVPADSVNCLSVGAADRSGPGWKRAWYSAVGPGRAPGLIKPDIVSFGGSPGEPFLCVDADGTLASTSGTSFASPLAMRTALGVRALFGADISPLALKALLIHTAEQHSTAHDAAEHGRGRVSADLDGVVLCGDGEARILYQGELEPAKYLRAPIPLPPDLPASLVSIAATVVYATDVDTADPGNYTRSGLDITFRPHRAKFNADGVTPCTDPFFKMSEYATEQQLRADAHKWDTVMCASKRKYASSLDAPVFDIHYIARDAGHQSAVSPKIRYAMVITVRCAKMPELYDRILSTYATHLEALSPKIDIRVET